MPSDVNKMSAFSTNPGDLDARRDAFVSWLKVKLLLRSLTMLHEMGIETTCWSCCFLSLPTTASRNEEKEEASRSNDSRHGSLYVPESIITGISTNWGCFTSRQVLVSPCISDVSNVTCFVNWQINQRMPFHSIMKRWGRTWNVLHVPSPV